SKDAVDVVLDAEQRNSAGNWRQDTARSRPEYDAHAFLENKRKAERRDDRQCGGTANRLDYRALDERAQDEAEERRGDEAEPEVPGVFECKPGNHGADHEEIAVGDVDDIEQSKNNRQAERDQRDDQPPDQPVQGKQQQRIHHYAARSACTPIAPRRQCPTITEPKQDAITSTPGWCSPQNLSRRPPAPCADRC